MLTRSQSNEYLTNREYRAGVDKIAGLRIGLTDTIRENLTTVTVDDDDDDSDEEKRTMVDLASNARARELILCASLCNVATYVHTCISPVQN